MKTLVLFSAGLLFPILLSDAFQSSEFIIWNVGQGEWITYVTADRCLHFDMGGEHAPLLEIQKRCYQKKNMLFLSHWDMDHINFIKKFNQRVFGLCFAGKPLPIANRRKQMISNLLPLCKENASELVQQIYAGSDKTQNSVSRVFYLRPVHVIIPGDSPDKDEKIWSRDVPLKSNGLILGHHGSRTSSSDELLDKLPHLKWSISTARQARYNHPHPETKERLKKHHISLLRTEDWGNIHFLKY